MENLLADVRYALRWLRRSPGFTSVAVASLAIGIGFNSALFTVVDAALFRPRPFARSDRLVNVYVSGGDGDAYATSSYPDYLDFAARNTVLSDLAGYSSAIAAVKTGDRSRLVIGEVVTGNFFQTLGIKAAIGRTILPEDDRPGAPRVVVISSSLWRRDFASSSSVLGQTMRIHGEAYTIVGVAQPSYTGMLPILQPEVWTPTAWAEEIQPAGIQDNVPSPGNTRLERRGQHWMFLVGRLKDGETPARAQANLQVVMQQLGRQYPDQDRDRRIAVVPTNQVRIHPEADRMIIPIAAGLTVVVGLVLLIACANVASMLLARASGRQKEIGIRLAVGASRRRLVQQLLTESAVLSALGAAAGIGLAWAVTRALNAVRLPIPIPLAFGLQVDTRVLLFTIAVSTAAGLVAGLVPALRATRPNLTSELKGDIAGTAAAGRRWTLRDGLVALQMAVTLVLLVVAMLLTRSIAAAGRIALGFRPAGLVAVSTDLSLIGYDDDRARQYYDRALERVRALPGVESAALTDRQPLALNFSRNMVVFPDRQSPGDKAIAIDNTAVGDGYFETLGVPIVDGRNFNTADTPKSPRVAIVNEAFARKYWPKERAIGKRFRLRTLDGREVEIVGVSADYKINTVGEGATPYIHYCERQRPNTGEVIFARTRGDAEQMLAAIRRELAALDPNVVFIDNQTMDAQVDATLMPARLSALAVSVVGLVAMVLAAVGLYGVIAYSVARRTREIGIRMALGAEPGSVLGLIMRQGLSVTAAGAAVGLLLAFAAAKAVAGALYTVGPADPVAWGVSIAVLLLVSALANAVPARRAARIQPSVALRTE
ncbi:MAG: ABC transporter permease [Betaproteobacteria bacterium]